MSETKILGNKAQFMTKVLEAIDTIATPVKATLGPDGLPILLGREKNPLITKDGVTVAESINVEDPIIDTMIQAIKEASQKTNDEVGDGTTTAIVLVESILKESMKFIRAGLITPQALVRELKAVIPHVIKDLETQAKKITSEEDINYVAMISANNDKDVADKVTEAVVRAGSDGVTSVEASMGYDLKVKTIEGFQISKGWNVHKEFAIKLLHASGKQDITYANNPAVVCYNGGLTDVGEFGSFLMAFNEIDPNNPMNSKISQIVIVAHEFGANVRQMMVDNSIQNGIPIMLVETESWGTENSKVFLLHDLASLTGGQIIQHGCLRKVIKDTENPNIKTVDDAFLGCCDKVAQVKGMTTFYGGQHTEDGLQDHIKEVRAQLESADHQWDEMIHRKRLARLLDGITIIECGGMSNLEIKERMDRIIDAVSATRAALKEGVVPGGGVALLNCVGAVEVCGIEDICGKRIIKKILESPMRQIIINTGESPDGIIGKVLEQADTITGYDAMTMEMVGDMFDKGIIDPLLVVKSAFQNAMSIGCEMLRGGGYVIHKKTPDGASNFQAPLPDMTPDIT